MDGIFINDDIFIFYYSSIHMVLTVDGLSHAFGESVIYQNVSFVFYRELYLVTGPNGIGKTALLEMLSGLLKPHQGEIVLQLIGPCGSHAYKKHLTYVPNHIEFFPTATAGDFVQLIASIKTRNQYVYSDVMQFSEQLGLRDYFNYPFNCLSFETKKKLFLTLLPMHRNGILLLDDPTHTLDAQAIHLLLNQIKENLRCSIVIIVTHEPHLFHSLNPTIIHLKDMPIKKLTLGEKNA